MAPGAQLPPTHEYDAPVAIIGAGPVGLALALGLVARGIACRVFERYDQPRGHSRSIGVHPVSLELFATLGLADALIAEGLAIRRGHAFRRFGDRLGSLDFACLPPPFRFVLAIPQHRTEAVLEHALRERAPDVLERGVLLTAFSTFSARGGGVRLTLQRAGAQRPQSFDASLLVGCDGLRSTVRELAGIAFEGGPYPDTFVMGDFVDHTGLAAEAAIFLHDGGLVESFPLPGGLRRWVVRSNERGATSPPRLLDDGAIEQHIRLVVRERLGHDLSDVPCLMRSAFGVQHFLARRFVDGRVVLAGDAAHVVSPIGGQGMNLGWLDAARLLSALDDARHTSLGAALARYQQRARAVARRATLRSAFYTHLGRARRFPLLRDEAIRRLLAAPALAVRAARFFTMRGLEPRLGD